MKNTKAIVATAAAILVAASLTACNRDTAVTGDGAAKSSGLSIGLDFPRSDSDFWKAFGGYVPKMATEVGGVTIVNTSSNNKTDVLASNMKTLVSKGAKSLVIAPQDSAAIVAAVKDANSKKIPVISVDTIPDGGDVYMVVRADNRAYGTKSCEFLGAKLEGKGKVAVLQGDTASINGRDRSEAFDECMKAKFPAIKVINLPTKWDPATGADMLTQTLISDPDLGGIYMQASIYMDATFAVLKAKGKMIPAGQPGHIAIISNDGVKSEYDAIKRGDMDATISQAADLYAKYGIHYAKAAAEGKTQKEGPTDHDSTIVKVREGVLQDLLPAPVVTLEGGKVGDLETLKFDDKTLWGNNS